MARLLTTRYCCSHGGQRRKKKKKNDKSSDDEEVMVEFFSFSATQQPHKNSVVRIVLASGLAELYAGAVSARLVMERYPGLCLARPEVFRRPHQSLVSPRETLLPGQKFYLVPRSTVERLMRRENVNGSPSSNDGSERNHRGQALGIESEPEEEKTGDHTEDDDTESVCDGYAMCSAKDFYVSKERWVQYFVKRLERSEADEEQEQEHKKQQQQQQPSLPPPPPPSLAPPVRMVRSRVGLLGGWKPNLSPVLELSP